LVSSQGEVGGGQTEKGKSQGGKIIFKKGGQNF